MDKNERIASAFRNKGRGHHCLAESGCRREHAILMRKKSLKRPELRFVLERLQSLHLCVMMGN
jgi:hypothetical protein